MIIYLTYNDPPSGIYSSQVIDVVSFLNSELQQDVKLVSFLSVRKFFENKKKIKEQLPDAIVLPMFPGVHLWRQNIWMLRAVSMVQKPQVIIGRSVLACKLGLMLKDKNLTKKVVYDGRGAIAAEWKEYSVVNNPEMIKEIFDLENDVVRNSNFRIAVSEQLVNYWKKEFSYQSESHVVIPCTLNKIYEKIIISKDGITRLRKSIGIKDDDVVFVYSGSIAGWQSFDLLYNFVKPTLTANKKLKIIFLSDLDENIKQLQNEFRSQVFCKKVSPDEVPDYLIAADYGLLIREESVTNRVASPVKFAEYIACGLKVIISDNLGDYSKLIGNNNMLGYLMSSDFVDFQTVSDVEKNKIRNEGLSMFSKISYKEKYRDLIVKSGT